MPSKRPPQQPFIRTTPTLQHLHCWDLERRQDGAVLVRVRSRIVNGRALPDAVFAFRAGDPQFAFWDRQMRHRETCGPGPLTATN